MNKHDLVETVVKSTGLERKDAGRAVDAVLAAITAALRDGSDVRLAGFGTFTVAERAASKGRDPRTGEVIEIDASKRAKFRPSKTLKEALG